MKNVWAAALSITLFNLSPIKSPGTGISPPSVFLLIA
jgi:hypothetical protein